MKRLRSDVSKPINEPAITFEQANREQALRQTAETLSRQLSQAKHKTSELVAAVERACTEAAAGLIIPPTPKPIILKTSRGTPEKAIILVGDLQLAKLTPTYSTPICERRMEQYA